MGFSCKHGSLFQNPYIYYIACLLQNLSTMNILDPISLSHIVPTIFASDPPKIGLLMITNSCHVKVEMWTA